VICADCGVTRGVVTSERIVESADRKKEVERRRVTELAKAEKEVAKADKGAALAREKLAALNAGP